MFRSALAQFLCACFALLIAGVLPAQDEAVPMATAEDREQLQALREAFTQALNSGDLDSIAPHLAQPFSLTFNDQVTYTDLTSMKAEWDRLVGRPESPATAMVFEPTIDAPTRLLSPEVGICTGSSRDTITLRDGTVHVLENRWTATLVKEGGHWKVSALHAGVSVMDNPVLASAVGAIRQVGFLSGLIGLILGAVMGVFVGRFLRKKS